MEEEKYIVACVNGVPPSDAVIDYSAWVANKTNKSLKFLHTINHQESEQKSDLSGSIGVDANDELLDELVEIEHQQNKLLNRKAKLILESAQKRVSKVGIVESKQCLRNGRLIENLLDLQDDISLAVIGRYGQKHHSEKAKGPVGHKVEAVIRSIHKPVLVVSKSFVEPKAVVLAFDGSKSANKALDFIHDQNIFKDIKIHIVYTGEVSDKSTGFLKEAENKLKQAGLSAKSLHLEGQADKAIFAYLAKNNIDMMIMGAYGHSWIHDIFMGSFTSKILAKNEIPLLLLR